LEAIEKISTLVHPNLPERIQVFAEKLRLYPEGCFVLIQDRTISGYAITHPWILHDVPELDASLVALPSSPDCLFVHDVALADRARGKGAGTQLMQRLSVLAAKHDIRCLALVAVYQSNVFWARFGFEASSDERLASQLRRYGPAARYMICRLD
jgi:N-acetylglutamate synthase-like GNAT family acetyltransferase